MGLNYSYFLRKSQQESPSLCSSIMTNTSHSLAELHPYNPRVFDDDNSYIRIELEGEAKLCARRNCWNRPFIVIVKSNCDGQFLIYHYEHCDHSEEDIYPFNCLPLVYPSSVNWNTVVNFITENYDPRCS